MEKSSRDPEEAIAEMLAAVVNAAVVIPESEARRALTWTVPKEIVARSIDEGRIRRVSTDVLAATE